MNLKRFSKPQAPIILESLSSLSYQTGELDSYLNDIACRVSQILGLDWSVVTLCQDGQEQMVASNIQIAQKDKIASLHGTLTNTVVETGKTLTVENALNNPQYGKPPEGYIAYLGVPLRTSSGKVIGTICSFCQQPREFIEEEVKTVELFAERAATAIDNYNLYQQQREFNQFLEGEVAKRTEELREAQSQLIEKERLAAIGEFASMIVHEIRNPLTTILLGLNYLKKICQAKLDQERICLALDEAKRLQNLLQEILLYAKPQVLQLEKINFTEFFKQMLPSLSAMPEAQERELKLIVESRAFEIMGDQDKLKQVLINLVRNACEAIAPGEEVTCKIASVTTSEALCFQVHNAGDPIPTEILPKLTQPFCTTKPGGTGLGLAIVKRIVSAHGGTLIIESDAKSGTVVSVIIPVVKSG